jgi:hypothetical protein
MLRIILIIRWMATVIFTILILPVIVANIQKLLTAKHWDEFLLNWWPNTPIFGYIIDSIWFRYIIYFSGGLAIALWVTRLWPEKDSCPAYWARGMMPLKEASLKLHNELYRKGYNEAKCGATINNINALATHISQVVDIYGKHPLFTNYEKISKDNFSKGRINDEGKIFYYYTDGKEQPKYIELSIKKSDCKKAIRQVLSYWQ